MSRRRQSDVSRLGPTIEFRCSSHTTLRGPRAALSRDGRVGAAGSGWKWKPAIDGSRWMSEQCPSCARPIAWSESALLDRLTRLRDEDRRVVRVLY